MIDFLDKKSVSYDKIEKILSTSSFENHYTNDGPVKRELESVLEGLLLLGGNKRVVCCSNGTAALHSIMFLCTQKYFTNINWVTPAYTFPSCVVSNSFNVDVLDIDPNTYTLPLDERLLSAYGGIIITNVFGSYVDCSMWAEYCKLNNKLLIFDNAASPLSACDGVNICNFGDYSFGSLHHTKYLGFGEGGFVVCPEEDYDLLNSVTNFGFWGSRKYKSLSSNFKMSDVAAAFILSQINSYDLANHCSNQQKLIDGISTMNHVEPFNYKSQTVYNTFPVVFKQPVDVSYFSGVKTHKYYVPLRSVPSSLDLYSRIINFPLYANLSEKQIKHIIDEIGRLE